MHTHINSYEEISVRILLDTYGYLWILMDTYGYLYIYTYVNTVLKKFAATDVGMDETIVKQIAARMKVRQRARQPILLHENGLMILSRGEFNRTTRHFLVGTETASP